MYYILYGFLYLLSLLPLGILYLLSDFAYFILYHLAGYRKKVVMQNLLIAFPEKEEKERIVIAKRFYKNFTDNFIEVIKFVSANDKFLKDHFSANAEVFQTVYHMGKKCQIHTGHNFNWELVNLALPLYVPYQLLTVYMPINNKTVDRLFKKIRTKTGAKLLAATRMHRDFIPYRHQQYLLGLVADQNPGGPEIGYWINFFGRPTPFVKGPEKNARSNDTAVIFCFFSKSKRGYYSAHFELATTDPKSLPEKELTKRYAQYLEKVIRKNPDMWLWSHRRWKHEWKPDYGEVIG